MATLATEKPSSVSAQLCLLYSKIYPLHTVPLAPPVETAGFSSFSCFFKKYPPPPTHPGFPYISISAADGSLQFSHPSSQQHLLVWRDRPKRVMVLKKLGDELIEEFLTIVSYLGKDQGLSVLVEPEEYHRLHNTGHAAAMPFIDTWSEEDIRELHSYVDFVVCLGGDGLVLHAAHLFGPAIPPVIAFRLGSLGFLAPHEFGEHMEHLDNVINGSDVRKQIPLYP